MHFRICVAFCFDADIAFGKCRRGTVLFVLLMSTVSDELCLDTFSPCDQAAPGFVMPQYCGFRGFEFVFFPLPRIVEFLLLFFSAADFVVGEVGREWYMLC